MDNPELIDLFESELDFLIVKAHRSGLSYWWCLRVILSRLESLVMQADVEYYVKSGK